MRLAGKTQKTAGGGGGRGLRGLRAGVNVPMPIVVSDAAVPPSVALCAVATALVSAALSVPRPVPLSLAEALTATHAIRAMEHPTNTTTTTVVVVSESSLSSPAVSRSALAAGACSVVAVAAVAVFGGCCTGGRVTAGNGVLVWVVSSVLAVVDISPHHSAAGTSPTTSCTPVMRFIVPK